MSGENDPKVAVDIGLSAKASLEVKVSTEIPAQSTAMLLDALTDIIQLTGTAELEPCAVHQQV